MAKKRIKSEGEAVIELRHFGGPGVAPRQALLISRRKLRQILEAHENDWAAGQTHGLSLAEAIEVALLTVAAPLKQAEQQAPAEPVPTTPAPAVPA